jgi:hypothetical protein
MVQFALLPVGVESELCLWVERGSTDTDHTVHARLARANNNGSISGQAIKLDVNGTKYTLTTNPDGCATQPLNLVAVGGQTTTYQIRAVFEGAGFKTKNLTVTDPYGRVYVVCTTMQWDFKASQNSVTLTVEAPKTDATVSEPASPDDEVTVTQDDDSTTVTIPPEKTPEQVQQEAEQSGWLTVWHEFSWWYPWYRFHLRFNMNGAVVHVGFNPILPGGEIVDPPENLGNLVVPAHLESGMTLEELVHIVQQMLEASIVDVLGLAASVLYMGSMRFPPLAWAAMGLYIGGLLGLGYYAMQNLYNAGSKSAGAAFMAGISIGLVSVLLSSLLSALDAPRTTIMITSVLTAIVGALMGSLFDAKPIVDLLGILIITAISAIAITALSFRIPEPTGNVFFISFLVATLVGIYTSGIMVMNVMR